MANSGRFYIITLNFISLLLAISFIFLADIPEEPFTNIVGLTVADSSNSYINESLFGLGYLILILTLILNVKVLLTQENKQ